MNKNILLQIGTLMISSMFTHAATYTVTGSNLTNVTSDTAITDNGGNLLASATNIAAIGYFKTFTDPGTDPGTDVSLQTNSAIAADFEILASNNFDTTSLLGVPVAGFYNINTDIAGAESNAIVTAGATKAVYLFYANNTNITSATQIAVVKTSKTVISDFGGAPPFQTEALLPGQVVVGVAGGSKVVDFFSTPTDSFDSLSLVLVPEPSSTVLLGLGGVALFLRRRR